MPRRLAALIRRKPRRMVTCAHCGHDLPAKKAVIIHGRIDRDRDAYATTVAEYHRRCAPPPRPDDPGAWVRHDWERP